MASRTWSRELKEWNLFGGHCFLMIRNGRGSYRTNSFPRWLLVGVLVEDTPNHFPVVTEEVLLLGSAAFHSVYCVFSWLWPFPDCRTEKDNWSFCFRNLFSADYAPLSACRNQHCAWRPDSEIQNYLPNVNWVDSCTYFRRVVWRWTQFLGPVGRSRVSATQASVSAAPQSGCLHPDKNKTNVQPNRKKKKLFLVVEICSQIDV